MTPAASKHSSEDDGAVPLTAPLQVFSTCPPSSNPAMPGSFSYLDRIIQIAQWSERTGCTGMLVYTDNSLVDPWLTSQVLIQNTERLHPLIALQPLYMHPYTAAKNVSTLGFLHKRSVFLNMVAGGFKNDLVMLGDETPHDRRYDRLAEYTFVMQRLLNERGPVSFEGEFYRLKNALLNPPLDPQLRPGFLLSGSSEAGLAAALRTGSVAIQYPEPSGNMRLSESGAFGLRIGVIARATEHAAWTVAFERFPEDRKGQLTRKLANSISDSEWHHRLAELGHKPQGPYWLNPFENYHTNCPYLVGSYEIVSDELARYFRLGYRTVILDIPASEEEFDHISLVLESATRGLNLDVPSVNKETNGVSLQ